MQGDLDAYDHEQDEPCQVRQMALLDELGQVSHVFSDKTGTLTSNHMEFRRCYILTPNGSGHEYGCGETAISRSLAEQRAGDARALAQKSAADDAAAAAANAPQKRLKAGGLVSSGGKDPSASSLPVRSFESLAPGHPGGAGHPGAPMPKHVRTTVPPWARCKPASKTYCNYEEAVDAPSIFAAIEAGGPAGQRCRELMLAMAVNHSVLLETVHGRQELSASSPDEQAFVAAAEHFGFDFVERDSDRGIIWLEDRLSETTNRPAFGSVGAVAGKGAASRYGIELLYAFPYESSRKRMSVIVRLPEELLPVVGGTERVRLYTKGADSVLCDLTTGVLDPKAAGSDASHMAALDSLLYEWADIALRTLVFAKRELGDFERWSAEYEIAISDPENVRKAKLREPNRISELQGEVENGLTLQGATAIEDKLQEGVPEILKDLRIAGIKVWMLTGDKVGTAKNIATACNILPSDADTLEITTETHPVLAELKAATLVRVGRVVAAARVQADREKARSGCWGRKAAHARAEASYEAIVQREVAALEAELPELLTVRQDLERREASILQRNQQYGGGSSGTGVEIYSLSSGGGGGGGGSGSGGDDGEDGPPPMCLVLDEKAIEYCGLLCKPALARVGYYSRSVVACRARKDQKAELLNLVKTGYPESCCLAIGDGANDVAMIRQGHIGVGIIGKEGMQAVNNSDFAIGQFQFLRQLLFVHGRFAYRRTSLFCYYMFYKNVTNVLAMYFYTLAARASGERLFAQAYLEVYNIIFTSLPIILFCVFDQDVTKEQAARDPHGYSPGLRREYYTHLGFVRWMAEAVFLAVLVTYIPALALGYPGWSLSSPANGDPGVASISMVAMTLVCVGVNLRLAIELHSWSSLEHILMWGSLLSIEAFALLFSFVWYPSSLPISDSWNALHGIVWHVWDDVSYWLVCVLVLVFCLGPRMLGKAWDTFFAADAAACMRALGGTRLQSTVVVDGDVRFSDGNRAANAAEPSTPRSPPSAPSHLPSSLTGSSLDIEESKTSLSARSLRTPSRRESSAFSISERANELVLSRSDLHGARRGSATCMAPGMAYTSHV